MVLNKANPRTGLSARPVGCLLFKRSRHLPIFTGRFQPTIFGTSELNFCCLLYTSFWRAVPFAKQLLENEIAAANAVNRADETVQNAYKNSKDGIVVLPDYMRCV